ncbi:MAG: O-methyltransferase [Vallitaleaceae bacterium]|nr:O-methyltransferase [Vallitaleaceae bacterium]
MDHTKEYLEFIQAEEETLIREMKAYAIENFVPIIKDEMKSLMEVLLQIHKPLRVLEIGTAMGYSAVIMCRAMAKYSTAYELISIERDPNMFELAQSNLKRSGYENQVSIIKGDASVVLEDLQKQGERFDWIFMDAAKGQYLTFLPYCLKLLKVDGLLISDNVLQDRDIVRSRFSVSRRQRTIHQRMREYLWELNHHPSLRTSILSIADGSTISVKVKE